MGSLRSIRSALHSSASSLYGDDPFAACDDPIPAPASPSSPSSSTSSPRQSHVYRVCSGPTLTLRPDGLPKVTLIPRSGLASSPDSALRIHPLPFIPDIPSADPDVDSSSEPPSPAPDGTPVAGERTDQRKGVEARFWDDTERLPGPPRFWRGRHRGRMLRAIGAVRSTRSSS